MKVYKQNEDYSRTVSFVIRDKSNAYSFRDKVYKPIEEFSYPEDEFIMKLPRDIYEELAQIIKKDNSVPDLEKKYVEGKLEATENHLKDMRKIVFKEKV